MGFIEEIGPDFRSRRVFCDLGQDLKQSCLPSILCGLFYHKVDPCCPYVVSSNLEIPGYLLGRGHKHASGRVSLLLLSAE